MSKRFHREPCRFAMLFSYFSFKVVFTDLDASDLAIKGNFVIWNHAVQRVNLFVSSTRVRAKPKGWIVTN